MRVKTTELQNHHMDSTRWDGFEYRDDDIVIGTWAKSGTTWLQQIVAQLIFDGEEGIAVMDIAPWIDFRPAPIEDVLKMVAAQTHRRFLKTHLPADAIDIHDTVKYLYVARDGRDALWSWHNHHSGYGDTLYKALNDTPGRVGPPIGEPKSDLVAYFHDWLDNDGFPIWPFFSNIQTWWDIREYDNVMLLHFNDLKGDLDGQMRKIADFLAIPIQESLWPSQVEHCTFDYMKKNASDVSPKLDANLKGGAQQFIYKGTNARWRGTLSETDLEKYDRVAAENLSPECARWLAGRAVLG
ncbi:MAG: sulfotransferase domain-containing protein [Pseudomonadota bacterium]